MRPVQPLSIDIDALLQDSYLLVVQLLQGAFAGGNNNLKEDCAGQVDQTRRVLTDAGINQRSIDLISHAQCALLDETVLTNTPKEFREQWASEPLQARYFQQHQAGEKLYENIRQVLSEPAPDPLVLTVFHRVLLLGFLGRYRNERDPAREQIIAALGAQVSPLEIGLEASSTAVIDRSSRVAYWLNAPLVHLLGAGLLLLGLWSGLDYLLGSLIDTLKISQVAQ